MSKHNSNIVHHPEVRRVLSKDTILPGTQIDAKIIVENTSQYPIESIYIVEGDIQPVDDIELFSPDFIESRIFSHQGIIIPGALQTFYYTLKLHPYSTAENIIIGETRVEFVANHTPMQVTIPGAKITVESIPIEDLEISEGYFACPNCGNQLELDTVLCTNCGFEINQETLQKIWANHQSYTKLIEEELIQTDEKSAQIEEPVNAEEKLIPIEEERIHAEEIPTQVEEPAKAEEKTPEAQEIPANMEIMYLKQAAQKFQENRFEECLLNLKITLQILEANNPAVFRSTNDVLGKLLQNIRDFSGQKVSKRTATTSLKFVINFVKSFKMTS
ncbi:MAG: zinc ribbon domain-containing protein [Promethearchaeota archaeon]